MFSRVRSSARASALLLAHLYLRPLLYARAYRLSFSAFLAVVRFKRASRKAIYYRIFPLDRPAAHATR